MLNIISEISEIERKMKDLSDEETVKNVEKMKEFLPVGHHSVHPTAISLPSPFFTIVIGFCRWSTNDCCEVTR